MKASRTGTSRALAEGPRGGGFTALHAGGKGRKEGEGMGRAERGTHTPWF